MNRTEWNALRAGDAVLVHVPAFPACAPQPGEVIRVTVRGRGTNDVAITVHEPTRHVVMPALTTVHHADAAATAGCWRCAELALAAAPA